jgi:hypothetical protein
VERDLAAEAKASLDAMTAHHDLVMAGQLPEDSPPDFVPPADGLGPTGLPWWMDSPDYRPTDAALVEFSKPLGADQDTFDLDAPE